jgi:hypothetical protein
VHWQIEYRKTYDEHGKLVIPGVDYLFMLPPEVKIQLLENVRAVTYLGPYRWRRPRIFKPLQNKNGGEKPNSTEMESEIYERWLDVGTEFLASDPRPVAAASEMTEYLM